MTIKTFTSKKQRACASNRKGAVLLSMVGVALLMSVMAASIVSFTRSSQRSFLSANATSRAHYLAESGLRYAQHMFCQEGWLHGRERTITLPSGDTVEVIRILDQFWATAEVDAATTKQARATVPMPISGCQDEPFTPRRGPDDFVIFGDAQLTVDHSSPVDGNVAVIGEDINIQGNVNGDVIARNIEFNGVSSLEGTIFSSGQVDITNGGVVGDVNAAGTVTVLAASSVIGGWIFSEQSVRVIQGANVAGHVHAAGGDVLVTGGASIGSAGNPVEVRAAGNVILEGSGTIYGDIYASGNVSLTGGTKIFGNIFAGGSITSTTGTTISGTQTPNSPSFIEAPLPADLTPIDELELPEATEFSAGGDSFFMRQNETLALEPGSYGSLGGQHYVGSNSSLTLKSGETADANYFFTDLALGQAINLNLDMSGPHELRIFVEGDVVARGALRVNVSTDGTSYLPITHSSVDPEIASRIYLETKGDFHIGFSSQWFGSVFTPNGNLSTAFGAYLVGSYISGGRHGLTGATITHVPTFFFDED